MGRRSKVWEIREDYRPLLKKIKKLFPTVLEHVRTKKILLVGFQNPSSRYVAQIRRNAYPWSLTSPNYDYVITFHSTRFDEYRTHKKLYVVLHELLHIPVGGFEKDNKHTYRKLKHHDVEDFSELIDVYGFRLERAKDIYKGEEHLLKQKEELGERDRIG